MADVAIQALPSQRRVGTDVGFAVGIVAIVTMLILPVPTVLIDMGLAFSIALSALILMVALWIQRPLDFSAFPTVLLIATILRLALNVATTRVKRFPAGLQGACPASGECGYQRSILPAARCRPAGSPHTARA